MTPPSRQASALDEAVRRLSRPSTSSARKHVDGSSAPDDVDDEASMDRYVADLLLQEARQPPSWRNDIDVPVRKSSNTRFLQSMLQSVHGHNERLIRATATSRPSSSPPPSRNASHSHHERDLDRQSRRDLRRDETIDRGGGMRGWSDGEGEQEENPRDRRLKKRRVERDERWKDERATGDQGDEARRNQDFPEEGESSKRSRRSHHERDEKGSRSSRDKLRKDRWDDDSERRSGNPSHSRHTRGRRSRSTSPCPKEFAGSGSTISKPGREEERSSKMDKYFSSTYDPRIDISSEVHTDERGLVEDEGWSRMLQVMEERREKKEERRAERAKRKLQKKELSLQKKGPLASADWVMDTKYAERGSIREWDRGKKQLSE